MVTSTGFGLVERQVGCGKQVDQASAVGSHDGSADRDGEPGDGIDAGDEKFGDGSAEPLGNPAGLVLVGAG